MDNTKVISNPNGNGVAINHDKETVTINNKATELPRVLEKIDVPDNVLVNTCPLHRGELTKAKHCESCEHFAGWWQRGVNGVFHLDYAVFCTFGIPRSLTAFRDD